MQEINKRPSLYSNTHRWEGRTSKDPVVVEANDGMPNPTKDDTKDKTS